MFSGKPRSFALTLCYDCSPVQNVCHPVICEEVWLHNGSTGQKSAQEKAQDKAGDAVDHLKETGQSAKKGIEHAADATKEKFQGN